MKPKVLYLVLCVIGFALPYSAFLPWVAVHRLDLRLFAQEMLANRISIFFVLDVIVSAVVLLIFIAIERRRVNIQFRWAIICALLFVGVSLALPLFLYLRESALDELQAQHLTPQKQPI